MPKRSTKSQETTAQYYDYRGVLKELEEGVVEFALEEELRADILKGQRKRRLENVSADPGVAEDRNDEVHSLSDLDSTMDG